MVFFILVISLVAFPNGPFTRPHPAVWRFVMGLSVVYLLFLVFLLLQTRSDAEKIISALIGEKLGHGLNAASEFYAEDCSVSWETVSSKFDRFVFAHLIGWVVKALMLRNVFVCWVMSVLWEITEVIFMGMLPNFAECWWDALILDVLVCNGLGIYIGMRLANYLEMRTYNWESISTIPTVSGKLRRAILQFTPVRWTVVRWELGTVKRFLVVTMLIVLFSISELNAFFLKHIFHIRSSHPINLYRMILWAVFGTPALRQLYIYACDSNCKRIGTQCWIAGAVIFVELFVCIKFGRGQFADTEPIKSGLLWLCLSTCFCLAAMQLFARHEADVEGAALRDKVTIAVAETDGRLDHALGRRHLATPPANLPARAQLDSAVLDARDQVRKRGPRVKTLSES
ncbi:phosphatidylserine synthase 1 [Capsaspora owczarzaki ATCC 30864]|nr:phosphatidylserine synthase 1 [Capsaspora owczarzaki ATCC 30864]|eukprot:XP_004347504.2 phosphatidylserine synthase 1 [Capsaspora owczarzaki ATCC 30864]